MRIYNHAFYMHNDLFWSIERRHAPYKLFLTVYLIVGETDVLIDIESDRSTVLDKGKGRMFTLDGNCGTNLYAEE